MTAPVTRFIPFASAIAGAVLFAASAQAGGCGGAECYRHVSTPPVYGAVSERVLVRPAETVYRTIPPIYETVSERVVVSPGGRVWQTRRDPYGELVGCWVDVPPQYSVRHRRVLVQPAQSIPETIPAEYASVRRRVLVQPARAGWVPANYGNGGGYPGVYGPRIGSIPDAVGIAGASSADIGVGLGFSTGSIYDGY
ncbi:hypothetical protein ASG60_06800 [Methylobacterium sp. Leaf469]|uniref:hypothetical protein n=1 Tax=Methylobacterium sp. Leaf469 TaxID=1736387 RepID=UPI0006FD1C48|nr:hypothetical protein [Methylobacterium sp. Leaf469]KQT93106.1 hypothetical protein ASG60_06800 [Methylobacterium sp. Leaf469]